MMSFPTLTLQLQTLKGEKRTAWLSLHRITVGEQKFSSQHKRNLIHYLQVCLQLEKPVILSTTPGFLNSFVPRCMRGIIPKPLTTLYKPEYLELSYHQLLSQCEVVFNDYSVTGDMARNVEKHTRGQALSKIWFQHRAGRVNASKLKAAVSTNMAQPSRSLIKALSYPESNHFKSEATSWGYDHEKSAITAYTTQEGKKNTLNFPISKSGLVIYPSHSFMGASPDSFVECKCCGKGVIEVKCPYSCKQKSIEQRMKILNFSSNKRKKEICI